MFVNDLKLYYLQQLGIDCWVKREPCSGNRLFCQIAGARDYAHAKIMIIGETSQYNEANLTQPFVGEVSELFDKMLASIGLVAQDMNIANTLQCRSFDLLEIEKCHDFLMQQIQLVAPQIILALGLRVGQLLCASRESFDKLRSVEHGYQNTPFIVTYSPDFLLHNPQYKKQAYQDLLLTKRVLQRFL